MALTDSKHPTPADATDPEASADAAAQELSSDEVKARAVHGASAVMARGFSIRALGLLGNVVLARLLTPADFGVAALGVTIIALSAAISDGGLATVFVRGKTPPTRQDLRAAMAVQAYISCAVVAACFVAAFILETREAFVVAAFAAPLSIVAFRVPAYIHFERTLNFGPVIRVEISETVVSLVVSIACAFAGFGVWSFVFGQIARVVVGTTQMVMLGPMGLLIPKWNTKIIRGLLKYGLQFQGVSLATLGLAQGINVAVAAAGGVAALGVWGLTSRLLQVPGLVFRGLRRVSYPGVARLLANGEDVGPVLLRVSKLSCLMGAIMVAPVLGGADPGVVVLFGDQWTDAQAVLPWCVAVVYINGPISVAAFSYATVSGALGTALRSSIVQAVAAPLLIVGLYPSMGLNSLIVATGLVAAFDALVLSRVFYTGLGVNLVPHVVFIGMLTAAAGLWGRAVALLIDNDGLATLSGAVVAELTLFALLYVLQRDVARDAFRLGVRAIRRRKDPDPVDASPAAAPAATPAN